jgi:hypothetical protein
MKTKKSNKLISKDNQNKKLKRPGQQKLDQDPKEFEENRSTNTRMKPQPYRTSSKKAMPGKEKK